MSFGTYSNVAPQLRQTTSLTTLGCGTVLMTLSKGDRFRLLQRAGHVIHQVTGLDFDGVDRAIVLRLHPIVIANRQERIETNLLDTIAEFAEDHHSERIELHEKIDILQQNVAALLEDVGQQLEHE